MCLSNDLDSLFSCVLLKNILGYTINSFYDFEYIYENSTGKNHIGVDIDLIQGKCWGNHVTLQNNKQCANINTILNIGRGNYTQKYCGSTALEIISYYNYDISNLSDLAKKILLCIDSTYLGYYFKGGQVCKNYLVDILELPELYNILENTPKQEFEEIINKYNLKSSIYIDYNRLRTDIRLKELSEIFGFKITLPKKEFIKNPNRLSVRNKKLIRSKKYELDKIDTNIFSAVLTYKDSLRYSKILN